MQHILVPVDFSEGSRRALRVALQLLRASESAHVEVLHASQQLAAWRGPGLEAELQEAGVLRQLKFELARFVGRVFEGTAAELGRIERKVCPGPLAERLLMEIELHHTSLVILTAPSLESQLAPESLGSAAETLVRCAGCPILVLPETPGPRTRSLLAISDVDPASPGVLQAARQWGEVLGAELSVLGRMDPESALEIPRLCPCPVLLVPGPRAGAPMFTETGSSRGVRVLAQANV